MKHRPIFEGLPDSGENCGDCCSAGYRIRIASLILASADPNIVGELSESLCIDSRTLNSWAEKARRALEGAFSEAELPEEKGRRRGRPKGSGKRGSKSVKESAAKPSSASWRISNASSFSSREDPNLWYQEKTLYVEKLLKQADQAVGSGGNDVLGNIDASRASAGLVPRDRAQEIAERIRAHR